MRIKYKPHDYFDWNRWFAWYPVAIGKEKVIFEYVERRALQVYPELFYEYRNYNGK